MSSTPPVLLFAHGDFDNAHRICAKLGQQVLDMGQGSPEARVCLSKHSSWKDRCQAAEYLLNKDYICNLTLVDGESLNQGKPNDTILERSKPTSPGCFTISR